MYILIHRIAETADVAEYKYGLTEDAVGTLRIEKSSGEVSLVEAAPGDEGGRAYQRAARKLKTHWTASKDLPERTSWAS